MPEPEIKVLICGDRNYTDAAKITGFVNSLPPYFTVIHGGARGADSLAGMAATNRGLNVQVFPALWNVYGKGAGPIRNQQMLDEGKPNMVAYFHDDLLNSKGTKNMVERAMKAGLTVIDNPYRYERGLHQSSPVKDEHSF